MARRVLLLDSGLGGLTVLAAVRERLPELAISYLADSGGFPYGAMTPERLSGRLLALLPPLAEAQRCAAVVLACNTASTIALAALREQLALPVVGVVPPIKPAAGQSKSRAIGLLATPATARGAYVDELIARFAADCTVVRVSASDLAAMAEAKCRGEPVDMTALRAILAPLFGPDAPPVDAVALGCTHYPLLLDELRAVAPPQVAWLEPGPAVARRLQEVLAALPADEGDSSAGDVALFTGAPPAAGGPVAAWLARCGLGHIEHWPAPA